MLVLAHVGITAGMARAVEHTLKKAGNRELASAPDYRLIVLGSLLPDLIDKPLGHIILRDTLNVEWGKQSRQTGTVLALPVN